MVCKDCKLHFNGECKLMAILHCDFYEQMKDDMSKQTVLPLQAVDDLLSNNVIRNLLKNPVCMHRVYLLSMQEYLGVGCPDYILAGLNCKNDDEIMSMSIHTYLMDWE